jgi:hypothetical protein
MFCFSSKACLLVLGEGRAPSRASAFRILEIELTEDLAGMMYEDSVSGGQIYDTLNYALSII